MENLNLPSGSDVYTLMKISGVFFLLGLQIFSHIHKRTGTLHNCIAGSLGAAVPCIQELPRGSSRQATGGGGDTMNSKKVEECWLN